MFIKFLGAIDILVGIMILFNFQPPLAIIILVIMFIKGLMSLVGDITAKIYGAADIFAGIVIFFGINLGGTASTILFLFFMYKGIVSLV